MNTLIYKHSVLFLFATLLLIGTANAEMLGGISDHLIKSILNQAEQDKRTHVIYERPVTKRILAVTATAYTSHVGQTDSTPNIAAWGDKLKPGMKVIAVSRDLLDKYGLKRGSKVKIHGQPGHYIVLDKMNKRWKKKIDIYKGVNKREAFKWGKRSVTIEWAS
jgi:3D (Asp-Asp-Asp) domain-containing protein